MQILTTLPQHDLNLVAEAAQTAERAGYDGIVTMENKHEPFLPLAVAATATHRIGLATGIAIAFARSPMAVANAAWDLQGAAKGRFVLGLGSQVRGHNERRFSVPWSAPAPRLREYVLALRAIFERWEKGTPLDFRGEHYSFTLMTPNFVPEPIDAPPPAITIAAVGPAMLRVAGEVCDGVRLHPFCTRRYLEEVVLPELEKGFRRGGRERASFHISGGGFLAAAADAETLRERLEWVRYRIAFYGSTPSYWPVLELHGLGDLGRRLNAMVRDGAWDRIAGEISDEVLALFCAFGTHDRIADAIAERFGGLVDAVNASAGADQKSDLPPEAIRDVQRLAAPFQGFAR